MDDVYRKYARFQYWTIVPVLSLALVFNLLQLRVLFIFLCILFVVCNLIIIKKYLDEIGISMVNYCYDYKNRLYLNYLSQMSFGAVDKDWYIRASAIPIYILLVANIIALFL